MDIKKEMEKFESILDSTEKQMQMAKGQLSELKKQLKDQFGVEDTKQANALVDKLTEELEAEEADIMSLYSELKERYEWN